jgi:hypothetical protein
MFGAYTQSKLADLIFAVELQRRLTAARSPILSVAAHPGYAVTNLHDSGPGTGNSPMKIFLNLLHPLSQDAHHGALPTLFAAVSPSVEPGGYYGPDGFLETKGNPTRCQNRSRCQGAGRRRSALGAVGTTHRRCLSKPRESHQD